MTKKKKNNKEKTVPVNFYVPDALHLAFKTECAKYRNINMSVIATELITKWLKGRGVEVA